MAALSAFDSFIEQCGGKVAVMGISVRKLKQKLLELTGANKTSYCDHLSLTEPGSVGKATVFVSYVWEYTFLDIVESLKEHFSNDSNVIIWFDFFSNNQHDDTPKPYEWYRNIFQTAITKIGRTVVLLSPWEHPKPLLRSWCLFEIYCSLLNNVPLEFVMSSTERKSFLKSLRAPDGFDALKKMLAHVDVANSTAKELDNKVNILAAVRSMPGGVDAVNRAVFDRMRDWVVNTAEQAVTEAATDEDFALAQFDLASVYTFLTRFKDAQPLYEACLKYFDNHQDSLIFPSLLLHFANLHSQNSNFAEAGKLCDRLTSCFHNLDKNEPYSQLLIAVIMEYLVDLRYKQGNNETAIELGRDCLAIRSRLTINHPDTFRARNNLARVLSSANRINEAEDLYRSSLAFYLNSADFGPNHLETVQVQTNLGILLKNRSDYLEAELLLVAAVDTCRRCLGEDHLYTIATENSLGCLFISRSIHSSTPPELKLEYLNTAKIIQKHCLSVRRAQLPVDHFDVMTSMSNLGMVYFHLELFPEAEKMFVSALDIGIRTLPHGHDCTKTAANNLVGIFKINTAEVNHLIQKIYYLWQSKFSCIELKKFTGLFFPETLT